MKDWSTVHTALQRGSRPGAAAAPSAALQTQLAHNVAKIWAPAFELWEVRSFTAFPHFLLCSFPIWRKKAESMTVSVQTQLTHNVAKIGHLHLNYERCVVSRCPLFPALQFPYIRKQKIWQSQRKHSLHTTLLKIWAPASELWEVRSFTVSLISRFSIFPFKKAESIAWAENKPSTPNH